MKSLIQCLVVILVGSFMSAVFAGQAVNPRANLAHLKELIRAEPWAYATIKEIIRLDVDHSTISKKADDGWQEQLQAIENHPNYVPEAIDNIIELSSVVAKEELVEEPMLWKVIAHGGREHYLFGTMHSLVPADFVPEALAVLQEVVGSVDKIMYESGSEQLLRTVRHALDHGEADHLELDSYIISLAMQRDKELSQLESKWEAQLEILRNEDVVKAIMEEQYAKIDQIANDELIHHLTVDQLEPTFLAFRAYVRRDLPRLQSLFTTEIFRAMAEATAVKQRNHNWLPRILANCKESSCLIVAGVRHMLADSESFSLISLLRQQGFEVHHNVGQSVGYWLSLY